jgi:hypothetical protein
MDDTETMSLPIIGHNTYAVARWKVQTYVDNLSVEGLERLAEFAEAIWQEEKSKRKATLLQAQVAP